MISLRQPEYTEQNRCWACTIVNCVIAIILAVVLSALSVLLAPPLISAVIGIVVLILSGLAIWLRGYLIPGTPTMTKRYMPLSILTWFENVESAVGGSRQAAASSVGSNLEDRLLNAGVLVECQSDGELSLSDQFIEALQQYIDTQQSSTDMTAVIEAIGYDPAAVEIKQYDDVATAAINGTPVHKCPSTTAVQVDLASTTILADWVATWDEITSAERGHLLRGVRLFIDECPTGGSTTFLPETESNCGTNQVAAVVCEASGDRLLEQSLRR